MCVYIFELPNGLYSASGIQDYFKYIIKGHCTFLCHKTNTLTNNPPIKKYVNKTEKRITIKFKTHY